MGIDAESPASDIGLTKVEEIVSPIEIENALGGEQPSTPNPDVESNGQGDADDATNTTEETNPEE